jgi:hypothetical protein
MDCQRERIRSDSKAEGEEEEEEEEDNGQTIEREREEGEEDALTFAAVKLRRSEIVKLASKAANSLIKPSFPNIKSKCRPDHFPFLSIYPPRPLRRLCSYS